MSTLRGMLSPFPKVHDVYVGKVLLGTVLATWAVLLGLDVVIGGLMSELDDIGQGDYGFGQALLYILYTVPRRAYALFPTAAVIGTLMGLGMNLAMLGTGWLVMSYMLALLVTPFIVVLGFIDSWFDLRRRLTQ